MTCQTKPLAEFAAVGKRSRDEEDDDEEDAPELCCFVCEQELTGTTSDGQTLRCYHEDCRVFCHALCLADHFLSTLETEENRLTPLRPERGQCPDCQRDLHWPLLVQHAAASHKKTAGKQRKRKRHPVTDRDVEDHHGVQNAQETAALGLLATEACDVNSLFQEEDIDAQESDLNTKTTESAHEDCIDLTLEED